MKPDGSSVEIMEVCEECSYNLGTAIKCLWDYSLEPSLLSLAAARVCIDREIRRREAIEQMENAPKY